MLIKPFTATVDGNGHAIVTILHNLHGMQWIVYQVGFGLGQNLGLPQVAAHVNGVPLMSTVTMQPSAFASVATQPPYAMESFMVGPPYITLMAGDQIVCAVTGANPGDVFTCAAYVDEVTADTPVSLGTGRLA